MINYLYNVFIIFGLLTAIVVCPYMLCKGIIQLEKGSKHKLGVGELLISISPVLNSFVAVRKYKDGFMLGIANMLSVIGIMARSYAILFHPEDIRMQVYTLYAFLGFTLIYWIVSMVFVYEVLNDSGVVTGTTLILMTLVFPIGQYYIGSFLMKSIEYDSAREDTFKWQS